MKTIRTMGLNLPIPEVGDEIYLEIEGQPTSPAIKPSLEKIG